MTANIQLTELYENCAFLKGLQESSIESPPDGKNGQCIVHYAGNGSKHLMYVSLVNGRRDGEAILLYDGTPLFYLEYSNGSLTGSIKRMNAYGTVRLKGTLLNGKETELFEEYDESGHVVWIGYYKNGSRWLQVVKDGIGKYYDKKSEMNGEYYIVYTDSVALCLYVNGVCNRVIKRIGEKIMIEYNENGKRIYKGGYQGSLASGFVRSGFGTEYTDNGNIALYSGNWNNGMREGFGTEYRMLKPIYTGNWKNGRRHGEGTESDVNGNVVKSGKWVNGVHESNIPKPSELVIPHRAPRVVQNTTTYYSQPTQNTTQYTTGTYNPKPTQNTTRVYNNSVGRDSIMVGSCQHEYSPSFKIDSWFIEHDTLRRIKIGHNSYINAESFEICNFSRLETISIGDGCFSPEANGCVFRVINCPSLYTIEIGESSFLYYEHFELSELNSLRKIDLGKCAFGYCHDVILNGDSLSKLIT